MPFCDVVDAVLGAVGLDGLVLSAGVVRLVVGFLVFGSTAPVVELGFRPMMK